MDRRTARTKVFEIEGRWLMGRVMPLKLMDGIRDRLRTAAPGREDELTDAVAERAEQLVAQDTDLVVDGPSRGMHVLSATVLAAHETLLPVLDGDPERVIAFLRQTFGSVLERSVELAAKALRHWDDPLDALDSACRAGFAMYGEFFAIEFDRVDDDTFDMRVGRCFFFAYFTRHGLPRLTTVLCAWDANWMQALDPAATGLVSDRVSLLSTGDDLCCFRVLRTTDPLAAHHDALTEGRRG
ncbi:hypothetical protein GCM10009836_60860 [Pseudonocardia ailaonensis]|uniref:L-2-amino-thiazoline-4-carboxylic acid hydrolase n=1 Tax=Pseudonocardia ailaonensis TaxID=367279 RepID=A0ABN2NLC9_9PSEU